VHYFLMEPVGGDLSRHDHEFATVRWVPFTEAGALLSFQTERDLVATAQSRLDDSAGSASGQSPRERAAASS
jgi:hypothetical protein